MQLCMYVHTFSLNDILYTKVYMDDTLPLVVESDVGLVVAIAVTTITLALVVVIVVTTVTLALVDVAIASDAIIMHEWRYINVCM